VQLSSMPGPAGFNLTTPGPHAPGQGEYPAGATVRSSGKMGGRPLVKIQDANNGTIGSWKDAGQGAGKESRRERGGGARLRGSPGNRCPNPAHAVGFYQRR
jgi:hypothetical protein